MMQSFMEHNRLVIWLVEPPQAGFVHEVYALVSESAWEQVEVVVLDLGQINYLNSHHLGEFALLKSSHVLEGRKLEIRNLHQNLFGLFHISGLDRIVKIEVSNAPKREDATFADDNIPCSLSTKDAGEQCANLKQLTVELEAAKTELEVMRRQLLHSEKVGTLGQLSAGIAHEFNNILSIISGYAQAATASSADPDGMRNALEIIEDSCVRAVSITNALLSFSRRKIPSKTRVDLNNLITQQLRLLSSEFLAYSITTELHLCEKAETMADPFQIDQVLLNLFTNAMHAMPEGGVLSIYSSVRGNDIEIVVADTGTGISERAISKIFTPFFTTKGALGGGTDKGTGLGLSVSQGIISNHNGSISVKSSVGEGTTFTISLPIRMGEAVTPVSGSPVSIACTSSKVLTILIVDDEAHIRVLLQKQLRSMGHIVLLAANGEEAIQLCRESCPDLILLDILMPGMNGADALLEIRRLHPDIGVVVITGQTGKALEAMLVVMKQTGNIELIRKPFQIAEVMSFVKSYMGSA